MYDRLPRLLHNFLFLSLPTYPFQVLEVAGINRCDVLPAEDTNFELLGGRVAWGEARTGALEVFKVLVDNVVRANVLGDSCRVTVVSDQLR
jgi:hypothetical protein